MAAKPPPVKSAKRPRWWILGVVVVVALAVAGLLTLRPSKGPLQVWHNGAFMQPGKVGRPFVWATVELKNPTSHPITLDGIRVQTGKLRMSHLSVTAPDRPDVDNGVYPGWPPDGAHSKRGALVPPRGVVLPKHGGQTIIFAKMVMPRPGRYPIGPVLTVDYHIGSTTYRLKAHDGKADMLCTKSDCPKPEKWAGTD